MTFQKCILLFCPFFYPSFTSNSHEIYWLPANAKRFGPYVQNMYAGEKWSVEGLIRKINIKSGTLDGRKIIQGLTFFLENGETKSVGMDMNDLVRTDVLVVPDDQHIRDFIIQSDSYIDAIGFETNKGRSFGPIGGSGGSHTPANFLTASLQRHPDKNYYYIDGIRGKTVTTLGESFICGIQLKYVCIPFEEAIIGPK